MNEKGVAIFALDTIGSVVAQAQFVSRVPLSECNEPLERARMETKMARVWVAGWTLREWV